MQKFITLALAATSHAQSVSDSGISFGSPTESPIEERKFSHIVKMVYSQITTAHSSKTISKMIQNYGCHCFPGMSRIAGGAGPAQDGVDDLCRILARCHKCIEQDYGVTNQQSEWDANFGKYRWQTEQDGSLSCNNNDDQYKEDLCKCDAAYATAVGEVWDDAEYNMAIWDTKHNNQFNFDSENVCVRGGAITPDSCCGSYPTRYPYDSAARACCAASGKTYNSLNEDCCPDGSVESIGNC